MTPGISIIFLLGLFWRRATEGGALVGAVSSVVLSFLFWFPASAGGSAALNAIPFMNRMLIVFFASLVLAVVVSLLQTPRENANLITMKGVSFRTSTGFNVAAAAIVVALIALYATWW